MSRIAWRIDTAIARGAGVAIAMLGAFVLGGWLLGIAAVTTVAPGLPSMKLNTALGLLLCGLALLLATGPRPSPSPRADGILAGIAGMIGLLSLVEHGASVDLHIDQLLWRDPATPLADNPGRMSVIAALSFVLFALGHRLARNPGRRASILFLTATILGLMLSYLALLGYIYGVPFFYHPLPRVSVALHTAASFFVLFMGLMALRPDLGWAALMGASGTGGALSRWMLPSIILLPPLAGWILLQGELAGRLDTRIGLTLFTCITVLILAAVLSIAAYQAERLHAEKERSRTALLAREARLRESEQLLSGIVSSSDDAMISKTLDGIVTSWNKAAERIFGYAAAEMIGQPISILTAPGRADEMADVLARIRRGERVYHYETLRRRKDGGLVEVSLTVSPIRDGDGVIIGASKIARDISAAKTADRALHTSEVRHRTTLDIAPVGIIHVAPDRRFLMANDFFCRLVGYDLETLLTLDVLAVTDPPDVAESGSQFQRMRDGEVPGGKIVKKYIHKSGRPVWCEVVYSGVLDAEGRFSHSVAIVSDITDRLAAEKRQAQLTAQLQQAQKMEAIGQLTGGMAHDFNNLLGVVLGNLDFLEEKFPAGSDESELIRAAIKAALHGAELTRRLLAFARQQPLAPKLAQLDAVLEGAGHLFRRTLGENIVLTVRAGQDLWPVMIDVPQFESALLNLAVNARDAMPEGGALTIEAGNVTLDDAAAELNPEVAPGDYLAISVSDTGSGMPVEIIGKVFDPFFTTKGLKGTGLGLSMVHGFVKQSGGHTRVYSEPGRGTTVQIYLPRARAAADEEALPESPPTAADGRETILVVEDNDGLRQVAIRRLRDLGYHTLSAADGAEGLAIVQGGVALDLLFTDVVMPGGMDGRALAAAARQARPGLRVLFTSGFTAAAASAAMAEEFGVNFLTKPYRKDELARHIRAALDDNPG